MGIIFSFDEILKTLFVDGKIKDKETVDELSTFFENEITENNLMEYLGNYIELNSKYNLYHSMEDIIIEFDKLLNENIKLTKYKFKVYIETPSHWMPGIGFSFESK